MLVISTYKVVDLFMKDQFGPDTTSCDSDQKETSHFSIREVLFSYIIVYEIGMTPTEHLVYISFRSIKLVISFHLSPNLLWPLLLKFKIVY